MRGPRAPASRTTLGRMTTRLLFAAILILPLFVTRVIARLLILRAR